MKFSFKLVFWFFILVTINIKCAKRGTIDGGTKDTLAPVYLWSNPKNLSTDFDTKEIKIQFDEYIKLKDIKKQLIISPPLKYEPEILPITASKYITIKIKDTLLPNTTYNINFGNSIQDFNEENPLRQFQYVFSTGKLLDSLTLSGVIKDAYLKETDKFVSVFLYEENEKFKDSLIYTTKPRYITNTLETNNEFTITNIKEGKYYLFALKDLNNNLKFDPKTEKIAFYPEPISIPTKDGFELELFKENIPLKFQKPVLNAENKIIIGYEGNYEKTNIQLNDYKKNIPFKTTKIPKKDSLQVWFNPIKYDSLEVKLNEKKFRLLPKKIKPDTLIITPSLVDKINFNEDFFIQGTTPFEKINTKDIKLFDKDSVNVSFTTKLDTLNNEIFFLFDKKENEKYQLIIPKNSITDYFNNTNTDNIVFKLSTRSLSDYGNLNLDFLNVKSFPIIVELTDNKGKILYRKEKITSNKVTFNLLNPDKFTLRIIYDENKNGIWDTGNLLKKEQSEEVIFFNKEIDVRANWDVQQTIDLNPK